MVGACLRFGFLQSHICVIWHQMRPSLRFRVDRIGGSMIGWPHKVNQDRREDFYHDIKDKI